MKNKLVDSYFRNNDARVINNGVDLELFKPVEVDKAVFLNGIFKNKFDQQTNRIKDIQQPTLILFGEKDQLINSDNAYLFQKDIKNSKVVILKNVGHVPMEEAPNETTQIIKEFIQ